MFKLQATPATAYANAAFVVGSDGLTDEDRAALDRVSHRQQYATPEQRAAVKAWLTARRGS